MWSLSDVHFLKRTGKKFHSQKQSLYSQINNTLFMDTDIITFLRLNYSLSSRTGRALYQ